MNDTVSDASKEAAPLNSSAVYVYQNLSLDEVMGVLRGMRCTFFVPLDEHTPSHPLHDTGGILGMQQIKVLLTAQRTGTVMLDYFEDQGRRGIQFFVIDAREKLLEMMPLTVIRPSRFHIIVTERAASRAKNDARRH